MTVLLMPPSARQNLGTTELRYPENSIVVVAGIPGAGKSTLLRRLFRDPGTVRVLDSERLRDRWMPVLRPIPYAVWRPLVHLTYYLLVLRAIRTQGPLVIHDCATRPWARHLIGRAAQRSNRPLHLILLDVPPAVARLGQHARARVVHPASMTTHTRRWPTLRDLAAADPSQAVPGATTATILNRTEANHLAAITFGPHPN
ncbi:putative kinase [Kribbella voronezhensis]|uniref:Putative kinase n=1 Tax=Kribbella voronezhensis TaxID=2512212 RepID=A0A4R7TGI8_9ACTN|nr:AAA family ATPase [Kribbella voronezhensis]TDU90726.1 putative kinase [Kribbella voronezhensis]